MCKSVPKNTQPERYNQEETSGHFQPKLLFSAVSREYIEYTRGSGRGGYLFPRGNGAK